MMRGRSATIILISGAFVNNRLVWNFEINGDNPLKIPDTSTEIDNTERWESRIFWPENEPILLHGLDDSFLELSRYQAKHRQDTYCLLADSNYNLKIRRNQLLYKPMMMTAPLAMAYGKKINLDEAALGAQLPGITEINAQALIKKIQHEGQKIHVEKEAFIYRFETVPTTKLELTRLCIANTIWFSVSVESRSRLLVESITQQMVNPTSPSGTQAITDYVTFLKRFQ